jgi:dGTPase
MKIAELAARLREVQGSLAHQKTSIESARRRHGPDADPRLFTEFIDPFLFDAEMGIVSSQAHRRQFGKSQVITDPNNPLVRTRVTHTGEVVSVATTIASVLGLNIQLTTAIALGHDIGHFPLGHPGERALRDLTRHPVSHQIMGVVMAQHVERGGKGLNLTHQVLTGMYQHSFGKERLAATNGMSAESATVAIADKVAYTTGDFSDALRVGLPLSDKLISLMNKFGTTSEERRERLIAGICLESAETGQLSFCNCEIAHALAEARRLMYEEVYPRLDLHNSREIVHKIFSFVERAVGSEVDPVIAFAMLTDQEVISLASRPVLDINSLNQTGMWENLPSVKDREIKWWELDLGW